MPPSPPPTPLALPALLQTHLDTLTHLYTRLSPAPASSLALSGCEAALRELIEQACGTQRAEAEREVRDKEDELERAWRRVNEWQRALGEEVTAPPPAPSTTTEAPAAGPTLTDLCAAATSQLDALRTRMSARGSHVASLHARLRALRATVGSEWFKDAPYRVEEEGRAWEEMDLRGEVVAGLEAEVGRCEAEVARRHSLLTEHCTEIYTLRSELGLPALPPSSTSSSAPLPTPPSPAAPPTVEDLDAAENDPIDAVVLAHLGVGVGGEAAEVGGGGEEQAKSEIVSTSEMLERVEARRKALELLKSARNTTIQTTYDELYPLWTMLGVGEDEMEAFVNRWMGSTGAVVRAYQQELARMLLLKRQNLATFIARERALLTSLWDSLYLSHPARLALFPEYAISVEPTRRVVRSVGEDGQVQEREEEEVSANVSEGLLERHERERERVEREVEDARPVLERLRRYFEVVEKGRELEAAAADPSRLMDKSRGAAMRLAQEAKDRKRVDKEKPKLESDLRALIPQWEAAHGRPFLVNGVSFLEGLDEQRRMEEVEKENRKRAKMGLSASHSSSAPARPLRAQHTGASSALSASHSSSSSHTVAPLKRQMTGASARSTSSATSSSSAQPPPAKRLARPPSRAALRETPVGAATPSAAPLKPQATGSGYGRARSGTVGAGASSVPPTPATAGSSSSSSLSTASGMRIPAGWGAGASGAGSPAVAATPTPAVGGAGGGRALVPQMTGGFRPRAG
ncbi:hypothetical protein JCM6882_001629 [Rhodosporidiobolus microsporus]